MKVFNIYLLVFLAGTMACEEESSDPRKLSSGSNGTGGWAIPFEDVYDGGPGKDGIPALEDPEMLPADQATGISDDELVVGVVFDGEARAYSHHVLDWHEIVNDQIGTNIYALTYCPLTGTAINWSRNLGDGFSTFGVSGLLYNSNLIPYDRFTDSNWSQMLNQSVEGSLIGHTASILPALETSWGTWRRMYPETKIISTNTGFDRPYGSYPYIASGNKDYGIEEFLIFPVTHNDDRLHKKERILGVQIVGETKAYRFKDFQEDIVVRNDEVGTRSIVIVGSQEHNFFTAFRATLSDLTFLEFTALQPKDLPNIMTDQLGNTWNIFGEAVSGPNKGEKLLQPRSYIGYWFAWAAFNPDIEIVDFSNI